MNSPQASAGQVLDSGSAVHGQGAVIFRRAAPADEPAIRQMARGERVNPNGLHWLNFIVAVDGFGLAGAAQLRPHPGGLHELGSLLVRQDLRGRQIATRLIDALMQDRTGRVLMVTRATYAEHYARWGFLPIRPWTAPPSIRRNFLLGQVLGALHAMAHGRRPVRLAVLDTGPGPRPD